MDVDLGSRKFCSHGAVRRYRDLPRAGGYREHRYGCNSLPCLPAVEGAIVEWVTLLAAEDSRRYNLHLARSLSSIG